MFTTGIRSVSLKYASAGMTSLASHDTGSEERRYQRKPVGSGVSQAGPAQHFRSDADVMRTCQFRFHPMPLILSGAEFFAELPGGATTIIIRCQV
jgi:hypothetical protein